jgi:hypothetical protein
MPRARLPFALLQWSRTDFEGLSLTLPSGGVTQSTTMRARLSLMPSSSGRPSQNLTKRVKSVVGKVFNVVGQWWAEQQKQVQEFQVLHESTLTESLWHFAYGT